MKTIKGPAIFLAQFMDDKPPFNNIDSVCDWASKLGYKGIQIPTWDSRCIDLQKVATDKVYAKDYKDKIKSYGIEITELSTHLQGQLVAVNPAYDKMFDGFAPENIRNSPKERTKWAIEQLNLAARASKNLGLNAHVTFSGALNKPMLKDKGTLSFRVSDILNSSIRKSTTETADFKNYTEFQWRQPTYIFTFTYRINERKNDRIKNSRGNYSGGGDEEPEF